MRENSAQHQQDVSNAVLQAETQLPSIIQNLTANNQTALSNATTARQAAQQQNYEKGLALFEQSGQLTPEAARLMGLPASEAGATTVSARKAAADAAYQQTEAALKQEGIIAANTRAAASLKERMAALAASGRKVNAAASREAGYFVDSNLNPILDANGRKIPVKKTATSSSSSAAVPPWGKG